MQAREAHADSLHAERNDCHQPSQTPGALPHASRLQEPLRCIVASHSKTETSKTRPCGVIAPERAQRSSPLQNVQPSWSVSDHGYNYAIQHPPGEYIYPQRNISPRQTFQENMRRIHVPPRCDMSKLGPDSNLPLVGYPYAPKNTKVSLSSDNKYCQVPYLPSPLPKQQRASVVRNNELNPPSIGSVLPARGWPVAAPPTYYPPEFYNHQSYLQPGVRSAKIPGKKVSEEIPPMYSENFYRGGDIRFEPYPSVKDNNPRLRYHDINYQNPYASKCDSTKPAPPVYVNYTPQKYVDPRIAEPRMCDQFTDVYSRQGQYLPGLNSSTDYLSNKPIQSSPTYPLPGKLYGYPESSVRPTTSFMKNQYDTGKSFYDTDYNRGKQIQLNENAYIPEISPYNLRRQYPLNNYQFVNAQPKQINYLYHYTNDNIAKICPENFPHYKYPDMRSNAHNPLAQIPTQFSPNVISPSESNTSLESAPAQNISQEDCGYVSQCSTASNKSFDYQFKARHHDNIFNDSRIQHVKPVHAVKSNNNTSVDKNTKNIDVRQFLQNWDENDDEDYIKGKEKNNSFNKSVEINSSENLTALEQPLYVLGYVNIPSEDISKYEHIRTVCKLPENIRGYDNADLLNKFDEAFRPSTNSNENQIKNVQPPCPNSIDIGRSPSPFDIEAKITQSVIHKDVGCNFEIKPFSPPPPSVDSVLLKSTNERSIDRIINRNFVQSLVCNNVEEENKSKHTTKRQFVINHVESSYENKLKKTENIQTNTNIFDDKGEMMQNEIPAACLASLPRLDNEMEINFSEINEQYTNLKRNHESVIINRSQNTSVLQNNDERNCELQKSDLEIFKNRKGSDDNLNLSIVTQDDTKENNSNLVSHDSIESSTEMTLPSYIDNGVQRTDSVIIKNPENIEYSFPVLENTIKKSYCHSSSLTFDNNTNSENKLNWSSSNEADNFNRNIDTKNNEEYELFSLSESKSPMNLIVHSHSEDYTKCIRPSLIHSIENISESKEEPETSHTTTTYCESSLHFENTHTNVAINLSIHSNSNDYPTSSKLKPQTVPTILESKDRLFATLVNSKDDDHKKAEQFTQSEESNSVQFGSKFNHISSENIFNQELLGPITPKAEISFDYNCETDKSIDISCDLSESGNASVRNFNTDVSEDIRECLINDKEEDKTLNMNDGKLIHCGSETDDDLYKNAYDTEKIERHTSNIDVIENLARFDISNKFPKVVGHTNNVEACDKTCQLDENIDNIAMHMLSTGASFNNLEESFPTNLKEADEKKTKMGNYTEVRTEIDNCGTATYCEEVLKTKSDNLKEDCKTSFTNNQNSIINNDIFHAQEHTCAGTIGNIALNFTGYEESFINRLEPIIIETPKCLQNLALCEKIVPDNTSMTNKLEIENRKHVTLPVSQENKKMKYSKEDIEIFLKEKIEPPLTLTMSQNVNEKIEDSSKDEITNFIKEKIEPMLTLIVPHKDHEKREHGLTASCNDNEKREDGSKDEIGNCIKEKIEPTLMLPGSHNTLQKREDNLPLSHNNHNKRENESKHEIRNCIKEKIEPTLILTVSQKINEKTVDGSKEEIKKSIKEKIEQILILPVSHNDHEKREDELAVLHNDNEKRDELKDEIGNCIKEKIEPTLILAVSHNDHEKTEDDLPESHNNNEKRDDSKDEIGDCIKEKIELALIVPVSQNENDDKECDPKDDINTCLKDKMEPMIILPITYNDNEKRDSDSKCEIGNCINKKIEPTLILPVTQKENDKLRNDYSKDESKNSIKDKNEQSIILSVCQKKNIKQEYDSKYEITNCLKEKMKPMLILPVSQNENEIRENEIKNFIKEKIEHTLFLPVSPNENDKREGNSKDEIENSTNEKIESTLCLNENERQGHDSKCEITNFLKEKTEPILMLIPPHNENEMREDDSKYKIESCIEQKIEPTLVLPVSQNEYERQENYSKNTIKNCLNEKMEPILFLSEPQNENKKKEDYSKYESEKCIKEKTEPTLILPVSQNKKEIQEDNLKDETKNCHEEKIETMLILPEFWNEKEKKEVDSKDEIENNIKEQIDPMLPLKLQKNIFENSADIIKNIDNCDKINFDTSVAHKHFYKTGLVIANKSEVHDFATQHECLSVDIKYSQNIQLNIFDNVLHRKHKKHLRKNFDMEHCNSDLNYECCSLNFQLDCISELSHGCLDHEVSSDHHKKSNLINDKESSNQSPYKNNIFIKDKKNQYTVKENSLDSTSCESKNIHEVVENHSHDNTKVHILEITSENENSNNFMCENDFDIKIISDSNNSESFSNEPLKSSSFEENIKSNTITDDSTSYHIETSYDDFLGKNSLLKLNTISFQNQRDNIDCSVSDELSSECNELVHNELVINYDILHQSNPQSPDISRIKNKENYFIESEKYQISDGNVLKDTKHLEKSAYNNTEMESFKCKTNQNKTINEVSKCDEPVIPDVELNANKSDEIPPLTCNIIIDKVEETAVATKKVRDDCNSFPNNKNENKINTVTGVIAQLETEAKGTKEISNCHIDNLENNCIFASTRHIISETGGYDQVPDHCNIRALKAMSCETKEDFSELNDSRNFELRRKMSPHFDIPQHKISSLPSTKLSHSCMADLEHIPESSLKLRITNSDKTIFDDMSKLTQKNRKNSEIILNIYNTTENFENENLIKDSNNIIYDKFIETNKVVKKPIVETKNEIMESTCIDKTCTRYNTNNTKHVTQNVATEANNITEEENMTTHENHDSSIENESFINTQMSLIKNKNRRSRWDEKVHFSDNIHNTNPLNNLINFSLRKSNTLKATPEHENINTDIANTENLSSGLSFIFDNLLKKRHRKRKSWEPVEYTCDKNDGIEKCNNEIKNLTDKDHGQVTSINKVAKLYLTDQASEVVKQNKYGTNCKDNNIERDIDSDNYVSKWCNIDNTCKNSKTSIESNSNKTGNSNNLIENEFILYSIQSNPNDSNPIQSDPNELNPNSITDIFAEEKGNINTNSILGDNKINKTHVVSISNIVDKSLLYDDLWTEKEVSIEPDKCGIFNESNINFDKMHCSENESNENEKKIISNKATESGKVALEIVPLQSNNNLIINEKTSDEHVKGCSLKDDHSSMNFPKYRSGHDTEKLICADVTSEYIQEPIVCMEPDSTQECHESESDEVSEFSHNLDVGKCKSEDFESETSLQDLRNEISNLSHDTLEECDSSQISNCHNISSDKIVDSNQAQNVCADSNYCQYEKSSEYIECISALEQFPKINTVSVVHTSDQECTEMYVANGNIDVETNFKVGNSEMNIQENLSHSVQSAENCFNVHSGMEEVWIDDIACVETVVSENVVDEGIDFVKEILINENDRHISSDDCSNYEFNCSKIRNIYGDNMDNNDINLVKILYKTPHMNVRDTLNISQTNINFDRNLTELTMSQFSEKNVELSPKNSIPKVDLNIPKENVINCDEKICISNTLKKETLITKAAQKYVPPLKISAHDLKVKLVLPQEKLTSLRNMKIQREQNKTPIPKLKIPISTLRKSHIGCSKKKIKPNFGDVLKHIDDAHYKFKCKRNKTLKFVPKVIIKKNFNGSHYTSKAVNNFNPDLTGSRWQPTVNLERRAIIEQMIIKKKRNATLCTLSKKFIIDSPKPKIMRKYLSNEESIVEQD